MSIPLIGRADVPDSGLQANNEVDTDMMIEGYKLAVARNGGMLFST